mmetsp:Transcript_13541/g.40940  ORF Transcript_13541/g.40940 Transcript_13541/m.40940 type:complete len:223 (-) Transcript_13541:305-973(-)
MATARPAYCSGAGAAQHHSLLSVASAYTLHAGVTERRSIWCTLLSGSAPRSSACVAGPRRTVLTVRSPPSSRSSCTRSTWVPSIASTKPSPAPTSAPINASIASSASSSSGTSGSSSTTSQCSTSISPTPRSTPTCARSTRGAAAWAGRSSSSSAWRRSSSTWGAVRRSTSYPFLSGRGVGSPTLSPRPTAASHAMAIIACLPYRTLASRLTAARSPTSETA